MHAVGRDGHMMAGHIAGGTHHAFYDYGEGFCVFSGNCAYPPEAPECFTDSFTGDFVRALFSNLDEDNAQMSLFRKISGCTRTVKSTRVRTQYSSFHFISVKFRAKLVETVVQYQLTMKRCVGFSLHALPIIKTLTPPTEIRQNLGSACIALWCYRMPYSVL